MSFDACNHEKGNLKYNIVRIINLETLSKLDVNELLEINFAWYAH